VDLEPVLSALAEDAGLVATIRNDFTVTTDEKAAGKSASRWIVLARLPEDLGPLARDSRWGPLQPRAGLAPWTDDYSSVVGVLRWR
jgi:hypothetical protein